MDLEASSGTVRHPLSGLQNEPGASAHGAHEHERQPDYADPKDYVEQTRPPDFVDFVEERPKDIVEPQDYTEEQQRPRDFIDFVEPRPKDFKEPDFTDFVDVKDIVDVRDTPDIIKDVRDFQDIVEPRPQL